MKTETIKNLIAENRIDDAFFVMMKAFRSGELYHALILNMKAWNDLKVKKAGHLISDREAALEENKIAHALLTLIDLHDTVSTEMMHGKAIVIGQAIENEIDVPDSLVRGSGEIEVPDNKLKRLRFVLHLVTTDTYYRVQAPAGIEAGKIALHLAGELFPTMKDQDFTWRLARLGKDIPSEFTLGAIKLLPEEEIFLTAEYQHKDFLPDFEEGEISAGGGVFIDRTGRIKAKDPGHKVLVKPDEVFSPEPRRFGRQGVQKDL